MFRTRELPTCWGASSLDRPWCEAHGCLAADSVAAWPHEGQPDFLPRKSHEYADLGERQGWLPRTVTEACGQPDAELQPHGFTS